MTEISPQTAAIAPRAPNGWSRTLLEGFRLGDGAALAEVYERHAREVAVLLRHGFEFNAGGRRHRFVGYGATHDLQDALHETFRRAFEPRARESYDGIRPYGPYVRTIARNVVLARFRKAATTFVPLDTTDAAASSEGSPVLADDAPHADRRLHDDEVRNLMAAFVAQLDELDRRLVELRFVEGQSQRDAARALGLGRQRVRTREARLRAALLEFLRARGAESLVPGAIWLVFALPGGVELVSRVGSWTGAGWPGVDGLGGGFR